MRADAFLDGRLVADEKFAEAIRRDGVLFGLVGELSRLQEEMRRNFVLSSNLTTPEGIASALNTQGYIKGLEYVITFIEEFGNE